MHVSTLLDARAFNDSRGDQNFFFLQVRKNDKKVLKNFLKDKIISHTVHLKTKDKKGIIEKSLVIMHENFDGKKKRVLMPGGKKPLFPLLFPTFLRFFVEIEGSSISAFAVQF